jgi:hypothetical protein
MFWFSFYATSNPGVMFHLSEKVRFQWIANAALMVDAFFAIRHENSQFADEWMKLLSVFCLSPYY